MGPIDTLFLDLGGVILTNGWDHIERKHVAEHFGIDWADFEQRHKQWYDLHETDELTLDEYLQKVVFWKARDFSPEEFKALMYAQSKPLPGMIDFIHEIKQAHNLRVVITSNEARELAEYRIRSFNLRSLTDLFFVSCFIHLQKPDPRFYQLVLDVTQISPDRVIYLDDRESGIEAAAKMGIYGVIHRSLEATREHFATFLGKQRGEEAKR